MNKSNLPGSPAVALLNRFFAVLAPEYQNSKKKKKVAILLTLGGSEPARMVEIVKEALVFFGQIEELRVEDFPNTSTGKDVCKNTSAYLEMAAAVGQWVAQ